MSEKYYVGIIRAFAKNIPRVHRRIQWLIRWYAKRSAENRRVINRTLFSRFSILNLSEMNFSLEANSNVSALYSVSIIERNKSWKLKNLESFYKFVKLFYSEKSFRGNPNTPIFLQGGQRWRTGMKTNRVSLLGKIAISATANYLPIGPPNCLSMICTRVANYRFTPLLISFLPFFSPISLACLHYTHTPRMHMQHTRFTICSLISLF